MNINARQFGAILMAMPEDANLYFRLNMDTEVGNILLKALKNHGLSSHSCFKSMQLIDMEPGSSDGISNVVIDICFSQLSNANADQISKNKEEKA